MYPDIFLTSILCQSTSHSIEVKKQRYIYIYIYISLEKLIYQFLFVNVIVSPWNGETKEQSNWLISYSAFFLFAFKGLNYLSLIGLVDWLPCC